MASDELTGGTAADIADLKEEYKDTPLSWSKGVEFVRAYCLSEIGKQPDDYSGPQRYCKNYVAKYTDNNGKEQRKPCCDFHGGHSHAEETQENLSKLANLSHGYYAMQEHLLEDLDENERAAYDTIMDKGSEQGITREDDFFSW